MDTLKTDCIYVESVMDDFSKEYGDQELLALMKRWLEGRMGGEWLVGRDGATNCVKYSDSIDLLVTLSHKITDLSNKAKDPEYVAGLSDALVELVKLLKECKCSTH